MLWTATSVHNPLKGARPIPDGYCRRPKGESPLTERSFTLSATRRENHRVLNGIDTLARDKHRRQEDHHRRLVIMTRQRLQCGLVKNSKMIELIRARHANAPVGSNIRVMEWFCHYGDHLQPTHRQRKQPVIAGDEFLASVAWRKLRMEVITERGARCECCGATPADGTTVIHVDHVKPRRLWPGLALVKSNLQVLCEACNHGKGNWDQTDWRVLKPYDAVDAMRPRLVAKKGTKE